MARAEAKISLQSDGGSDRERHTGGLPGGGDPGPACQRTRGSEPGMTRRGRADRVDPHGAGLEQAHLCPQLSGQSRALQTLGNGMTSLA